jgi:hypothetical protein
VAAVVLVATAGLVLTEQAAFADATVSIDQPKPLPSQLALNPGQSVSVQFTVKNDPAGNVNVTAGIDAGLTGLKISSANTDCGTVCTWSNEFIDPAGKSYTVKLTAPATIDNTVTGKLSMSAGGTPAEINVALTKPQTPTTVPLVSGTVVDVLTGQPIPNADVTLIDGDAKTHNTKASTKGAYVFKSTDADPIIPGTLTIGATADNYDYVTAGTPGVTRDGRAGVPVTGVKISLKNMASATASASPESTAEATPTGADPTVAVDTGEKTGGGPSMLSWILIVLGGVLVALGIGAVVLLMVRRNQEDEDDAAEPKPGPRDRRGGGRPPVGARGGPVRNPRGPGGPGGPGGRPVPPPVPGPRPAIMDAPTMVQGRPPVGPHADPYAAPTRIGAPNHQGPPGRGPGYGPGGYGPGGYGAQPTQIAPAAPAGTPSYGPPTSGGGYGQGRGGYEQPSGYNGNGYNGSGGYSPPPSQYSGGSAGPYDQRGGGYDQGGYGGNGYSSPGGQYGSPASAGPSGPYDQRGGGYDQGGYGGNGYLSPGGQHGSPAGPGYDDRGYDQGYEGGSRHSAPPSPHRRGQMDWLDD